MERISLGALIIALCMLTDNAIIVIEGIKVGIESGRDKLEVVRRVLPGFAFRTPAQAQHLLPEQDILPLIQIQLGSLPTPLLFLAHVTSQYQACVSFS